MPLDGEWELIDRLSEDDLRRIENERDFSRLRQILSSKDIDIGSACDCGYFLAVNKGLYVPAVTIVEGLLRIDDSELGLPIATYLHERTHANYSWLLNAISQSPNISARELGIPMDSFELKTHLGGVYIELGKFRGVSIHEEFSKGSRRDKMHELCLGRLHLDIANYNHSNKDCPYLELLKQ